VEINTSGLHKPVQEMYPALENLKIYCAAGIPLTFGSDSHDPAHVGRDFQKAVDMAQAAGFSEYVLFRGREIERQIKL
jgi:histidinol-phosphatase (PHP family)